MVGVVLQLLSFGFGLYGWINSSQESVIIAGIFTSIILLLGIISGALNGLGFTIIFGIIGAIFISGPWWFGAIIAISILDGIEAIMSVIILFNAKSN